MIPALVVLGLAFMALERLRPDQDLPGRASWWPRAILLNASQVAAVDKQPGSLALEQ